jgi:hypothetical protein
MLATAEFRFKMLTAVEKSAVVFWVVTYKTCTTSQYRAPRNLQLQFRIKAYTILILSVVH